MKTRGGDQRTIAKPVPSAPDLVGADDVSDCPGFGLALRFVDEDWMGEDKRSVPSLA